MKAAYVAQAGQPLYGDFADPQPTENMAVVEIGAAALTNLDIAIAAGKHYFSPDSFPFVAGREAVARTGDGRRLFFNVKAMAFPFGSMAERALVNPQYGLPVPGGVPDVLAAALGNAGLAAWLPLSWRARLKAGERVLILGATGASGLIAVAAARLLGAGRVVAAGRDPNALATARRLGAGATVDLAAGHDLAAAFRAACEGEADVVLDYLNGAPAEAALQAMAPGGRMVQIGQVLAPAIHLPAGQARRQSLDVLGFAYYHAPVELQAQAYERLCHHALAGEIAIDYTALPLTEIGAAWRRQIAGSRSRLVLVP